MSYTVIWKPQAKVTLTQLWMDASDRGAITRAADKVDALLKSDAASAGESREEVNSRIIIEQPLGFAFRVYHEDYRVEVLSVWGL